MVVAAVAGEAAEGISDTEEAKREVSMVEALAAVALVAAPRAAPRAGEVAAACKAVPVLAWGRADALALAAESAAARAAVAAMVVPMEAAVSAQVAAAFLVVTLRVLLAASPMTREAGSVAQAADRVPRAACAGA